MRIHECEVFRMPETESLRHLPEGPRRLTNYPGDQPLVGWVAIQHGPQIGHGSINVLNLRTRENVNFPLPGRVGFFAETSQPGVLALGMERRLVLYDLASRQLLPGGVDVAQDQRVIINEGLAVTGGLLFGTKHLTFTEHIARVYWFDAAKRTVREMPVEQICSNGKFLFNAGGRAHLVDICSFSKQLNLYDVDLPAGRMDHLRVVADFNGTPLFPDGLRPTPDGRSVVVAFYNPDPAPYGVARQIRIADGVVEAEWRLPGSPRVTCPEFVRFDARVQLLFTTAVEGMPAEVRQTAPNAGALFVGDTDFEQLPEPPPLLDARALRGSE